MLQQKIKRNASATNRKTGDLSGIWAAMSALITAVQLDQNMTSPDVFSRMHAKLRDLHRAGIIDQSQLAIAHQMIEVWTRSRKASALRIASQRRLAALLEWVRPLDRSSDVPDKVAEHRALCSRASHLSSAAFPLEVVHEAMEYALTLDDAHLRYRSRFAPWLQDALDEPKLPDLLVRSVEFADAVFEKLQTDYPNEMAEVEAYCEAMQKAGIPLTAVAGTDDATPIAPRGPASCCPAEVAA